MSSQRCFVTDPASISTLVPLSSTLLNQRFHHVTPLLKAFQWVPQPIKPFCTLTSDPVISFPTLPLGSLCSTHTGLILALNTQSRGGLQVDAQE